MSHDLVWHKGFIVAEKLPPSYLIRFLKNDEGRLGPSNGTCIVSDLSNGLCEVKALVSNRKITLQERRDLGEFALNVGFTKGRYERFDENGLYATVEVTR